MTDLFEKQVAALNLDKSDWQLVKFGDIAIQQKKKIDRENTELTRYVKGEHMHSEDIHLREWGELKDEYLGPAFIRKFEKGDILYGSRRTYLRKVVVAPFDGITSNTTFVIKANEKKIDKCLLPFIMLSEGFSQHSIKNSKGSVNPYINWKDIASYEFLLPPVEQQKVYLKILLSIDEVVSRYKDVINKLTIYKKSLMKKIFYGESRFGGFREEKVLRRLDEAAEFRRGSFPQPYGSKEWYDEVNGEPFVQVYDIGFDMKLKPNTKVRISKAACEKSVFAPKGTLIISIQGSIGRVAITQYDAYIDRTILIFQKFLVPIEQVYFSYVLEDLFYKAEKTAPGATIKTITKEALSSFEVWLPCLDEQIVTGQLFTDCDMKINEARKALFDISCVSSAIKSKVF